MVFKSLPFQLACVPWSWLWGQHRPLIVPVSRLSRCWVVILRISYHLCNGLQTALISSRWTTQSGTSYRCASTARESVTSTTSLRDLYRSGPDLTTRSSALQLLSSKLVCMREGGQRWHFAHFYDNWWMTTLLHCFLLHPERLYMYKMFNYFKFSVLGYICPMWTFCLLYTSDAADE